MNEPLPIGAIEPAGQLTQLTLSVVKLFAGQAAQEDEALFDWEPGPQRWHACVVTSRKVPPGHGATAAPPFVT